MSITEIKILLAEDDPKLGNTIKSELISNGYDVDLAFDGKIAETLFSNNTYALALLDINLPYVNGWELCKQFREKNRNIPIIMLTALGELQDKMDAFNNGADDYLVKPFHLNELLARIRVFLKRIPTNEQYDELLTESELELNAVNKIVKREGREVMLTAKEFALLELLMRAKGRVVSKAEIAEKVWNINFDTGTNTIEVYINFLRNKIDKPFSRPYIHTKSGFGYYLKDNG